MKNKIIFIIALLVPILCSLFIGNYAINGRYSPGSNLENIEAVNTLKRKAYITNIIFSAVALGLGVFTFIEGQWIFGIIFIALAIMTSVQIFTMEKRIDQELYKYYEKRRSPKTRYEV